MSDGLWPMQAWANERAQLHGSNERNSAIIKLWVVWWTEELQTLALAMAIMWLITIAKLRHALGVSSWEELGRWQQRRHGGRRWLPSLPSAAQDKAAMGSQDLRAGACSPRRSPHQFAGCSSSFVFPSFSIWCGFNAYDERLPAFEGVWGSDCWRTLKCFC